MKSVESIEPAAVLIGRSRQIPEHCGDLYNAKWDFRFLSLAQLVSSWSKDPSTKCGAVIVRPDRSVASVGFNGFPRGVHDFAEHYANRTEKYGRVVHAEVNAILAAKEPLAGCTMYTYPAGIGPSCDRCTACIIQAGVRRVVHLYEENEFHERWREPVERGLDMYASAGLTVISYHLIDFLDWQANGAK